VYVVDGFLHALPFPDQTADVVVTCHSLGWELRRELTEIERVLRPGGSAVHVFGVPAARPSDGTLFRALVDAGDRHHIHQARGGLMHRYDKRTPKAPA
jgi:ubiquinone/menaquinone biosynthesis C-methylase UbiE